MKPKEALEIGLLTIILSADKLLKKSLDFARRLSSQATGAVSRIKRRVMSGYRDGFESGLTEEASAFSENIRTRNAKEGLGAFLTGRKPDLNGT